MSAVASSNGFLAKLFSILSATDCSHIVSWNPNGTRFVVHDTDAFCSQVLPHYFKHNNLASFVRQLNMYSFHKFGETDVHEYAHPNFLRDDPSRVSLIKRKPPAAIVAAAKKDKTPHVQAVGADTLSTPEGIHALVAERDALAAEVASLRVAQQQLTQKMQSVTQLNSKLWSDFNESQAARAELQKQLDRISSFISVTRSHGIEFPSLDAVPTATKRGRDQDAADTDASKRSAVSSVQITALPPAAPLIQASGEISIVRSAIDVAALTSAPMSPPPAAEPQSPPASADSSDLSIWVVPDYLSESSLSESSPLIDQATKGANYSQREPDWYEADEFVVPVFQMQ